MPPGYKVRDKTNELGPKVVNADKHYRRSSVTSLLFRCGGCSSIVSCIVEKRENKCILFTLRCERLVNMLALIITPYDMTYLHQEVKLYAIPPVLDKFCYLLPLITTKFLPGSSQHALGPVKYPSRILNSSEYGLSTLISFPPITPARDIYIDIISIWNLRRDNQYYRLRTTVAILYCSLHHQSQGQA